RGDQFDRGARIDGRSTAGRIGICPACLLVRQSLVCRRAELCARRLEEFLSSNRLLTEYWIRTDRSARWQSDLRAPGVQLVSAGRSGNHGDQRENQREPCTHSPPPPEGLD